MTHDKTTPTHFILQDDDDDDEDNKTFWLYTHLTIN